MTLGCLFLTARTDQALLAQDTSLQIEVDARELPRRLIHSTITIPCKPGPLAIWYPKWIPGTHSPSGPLDTIGGLRVETEDGKEIPWRRDEQELYRITCTVPDGSKAVRVKLDTICNASAVDASGHLSYGNNDLGILNWPTCLVYPEGPTSEETKVDLSLYLPEDWKFATALEARDRESKPIRFTTVSLFTLGDSPLIAGRYLRTIPLEAGSNPPADFHLVSESKTALELDQDVIDMYSRMVREAGALFGASHYDKFHFLVTCSDDLGTLGLEHLSSSINGVRERDLIDSWRRKGWIANLIPHEYVHSWCGKYRIPVGQHVPNFHTPMKTGLLWVYEGLTEYLGELLMVRSGLVAPDEYKETLNGSISGLMLRTGRNWRSLEDTAIASQLLRAGSANWNEMRRDQDYYHEGALLWLNADAIIREKTEGKKSIEDFCKRFLGKNDARGDAVPYDLAEVVKHLNDVVSYDWEKFLTDWVSRPHDALPLDLVGRIGYRLQFSPKPSNRRPGQDHAAILHSIGVAFGGNGEISDIVPGMAGDRAKLAPGMKVMGVNGRVFSQQRLQDAIAESVSNRKIELLLVEGDHFRTVELEYGDGLKYLELVRDESKPDLLTEILKPISGKP